MTLLFAQGMYLSSRYIHAKRVATASLFALVYALS
jgi:hypothetical protein